MSGAAGGAARGAELVLDWRIRVWVLLPITLAAVLMSFLRRNLSYLIMRTPRVDLHKVRDAGALRSASSLRRAARSLHPAQARARAAHLGAGAGPLRRSDRADQTPLSAMLNPDALGNQVGALLSSTVPSMLLGAWARYAFGGVAVVRLPFALSPRFRGMLQSGIERAGQSLDVRYVSSLSWYVISLLGVSSLVALAPVVHKAPVRPAAALAVRLSAAFKGFNDARVAEQARMVAFDPGYTLPLSERALLASDPRTCACL